MAGHGEYFWRGTIGTMFALAGAVIMVQEGPGFVDRLNMPAVTEFYTDARPIFNLGMILIGIIAGEIVGIALGTLPDKTREKGMRERQEKELRDHYNWVDEYAKKRD